MTKRALVALALVVSGFSADTTKEAAAARRFAAIRNDPLRLRAFLHDMPKGGDLHNHLSGAIYAESYLRWAAEDKLCLATGTMTIVAGTCDASAGRPPAADVLTNAALYGQAVDAMSMRHWNRSLNGHDHFFSAFAKFGVTSLKTGDMIAEVMARAAGEHVSYLELMLTPVIAATLRFAQDAAVIADPAEQRTRLLSAGFRNAVVAEAKQRLDEAETRARELLHCSTPAADAGCRVTVRYIAQVARAAPPPQAFAQILAGFELAAADPRIVSLNLVQAEDDPRAVANFDAEMRMLGFLHEQYPAVPIALHAGELTEGLVPPEVLRSHIRDSIEKGHAQRIGHGVSVMDEDDPLGLLREMAARKVLVEIGMSSNDYILDVRGRRHPLDMYLRYGVPVAIATDDMGVSRSTHTDEFVKAVQEHGLDYLTVKKLVRNSLAYAFADAKTKRDLQAGLERDLATFEREAGKSRTPNR